MLGQFCYYWSQSSRRSTVLSISLLTSPGLSPEEPPDDKRQPLCAWGLPSRPPPPLPAPRPVTREVTGHRPNPGPHRFESHAAETVVFAMESEN